MGLFDKMRKVTAEETAEMDPKQDDGMVRVNEYVNLTEKMVKVDVDPEHGTMVKGVYIWEDDEKGTIRGLIGEDVIFEVGKRSKAYGELKKLARTKTEYVNFRQRESDYGVYYRMQIARQLPIEDTELVNGEYVAK